MPPRIVGIAGSFNRPSKTRVLVEHVAALQPTAMVFPPISMICRMSVRRSAQRSGATNSTSRRRE